MSEQTTRRGGPLKVRHKTREGGKPVVIEEKFGEEATKIRHQTMIHGKPTTIVREDSTERVEKTLDEDPEGLRPVTSSQRGSFRGRRGSED